MGMYLSKASHETQLKEFRGLFSFRISGSFISPEEWAVAAHTVIHSRFLVIQVDPTERLKVNYIRHVQVSENSSRRGYSRFQSTIKAPNKALFVLIWWISSGRKLQRTQWSSLRAYLQPRLYCAKYSNYDITSALYLCGTFHSGTSKSAKMGENSPLDCVRFQSPFQESIQ